MSAVDAYKVSFSVWHFFLAVLLVACPAIAQTQSEAMPGYSVLSPGLSNQNFYCHAGYNLADCRQEVAELKTILARYPAEELGPWTWVLVRSQDWIPISVLLGLKPESPAFTAVDQRETFLEEALFKRQGLRAAELQREWLMPREQLLDLAVTHELGHALCSEPNEAVADRFGEELRRGHRPHCRSSKVRSYTPIHNPDTAQR
jgi:hypothetical protein